MTRFYTFIAQLPNKFCPFEKNAINRKRKSLYLVLFEVPFSCLFQQFSLNNRLIRKLLSVQFQPLVSFSLRLPTRSNPLFSGDKSKARGYCRFPKGSSSARFLRNTLKIYNSHRLIKQAEARGYCRFPKGSPSARFLTECAQNL